MPTNRLFPAVLALRTSRIRSRAFRAFARAGKGEWGDPLRTFRRAGTPHSRRVLQHRYNSLGYTVTEHTDLCLPGPVEVRGPQMATHVAYPNGGESAPMHSDPKRVFLLMLPLVLGGVPTQALAQAGKIVGRVVDAASAQPIASAQVHVEGRSAGDLSSIDGRFVLRTVAAGTHSVVVQMLGYTRKTVTGVVVGADSVTNLDISLEQTALELAGLVVAAAVETGSTAALLTERRTRSFVVDAIGADQISRSPDGDAAAALKRVPGLSVVDGRFAYVRGLGERYSGTTLNGAPLASPMPDRKAVPLNVVPSDLLQSIVTAKSYSPDQPGDYAGGLVELRTKDFPTRRILSLSASGSYNSTSTFQDGLRYAGGGLDFLGFDDGTRSLPDELPTDERVIFPNFSRSDLERYGEAFAGDWGPIARSLPPNTSLGFSFGDDLELFERSFGVLGSLTWSNSYGRKDDIIERVFSAAGVADPEIDYTGNASTRSVSLGALANLSYELSPTDRITANFVYSHLMDDEARTYQGFNLDTNTDQRNHRLRFLGQTLTNTQLKGEHLLGFPADAKLDWRAAWSRARRFEPNTREVLYREEDGEFRFYNFVSSGSVFHQDLVDDTHSGALDIEFPFTLGGGDRAGMVKVGGSLSAKTRDAFTRRFRFLAIPGGVVNNAVRERHPNDLFDTETIAGNGFELQEATFRPDNYDASEDVLAGYAMFDARITGSLKLMTGLRVESAAQQVAPRDLFDIGLEPLEGASLDDTDLLPALNLTLRLRKGMNLRFGASRTLARPQLRELAPFAFADYAGGYLTVGNPELNRSLIRNFDARWEKFLGGSSLLAASAFYKTFVAPIEVAVLPSTELLKTWVNGGPAINRGVELEVRTGFGGISPALAALSLNTNLTLVQSRVKVPGVIRVYIPGEGGADLPVVERDRALQGQSPYIVNVGLTWAREPGMTREPRNRYLHDLQVSVLFNRFGRRIDAIGGQATPDIYEEARSQLDIVVERRILNGARLTLSASRLVGNRVEFTQDGGLLRQWDSGRTVSLSIGWETGK